MPCRDRFRARLVSLAVVALGGGLAGCLLGPNYQRPAVQVPKAYRGQPAGAPSAAAASLGDAKWWSVFQDPVLQQLIRTAIERNYDVRIAATRVLEAQAELGITRANQFPSAGVGSEVFSERNPKISSAFPAYGAQAGELNLSVLWNLDFWGKYRRETEAARAALLASQWGQREVLATVVAGVASAYFQLRELDLALSIARKTVAARQDSLRLELVLQAHGGASLLDVRAAQELVYTASETIPDLERESQQEEDAISVLIGGNPAAVPRGWALTQEPNPPSVPPGIPSQLLERRPDIRAAEANLIAANAEVGVAKAAYFPNISLTGEGGLESYALNQLFHGAARQWNTNASLSQPIFEAGSLHAGMQLTEAQKAQMVFTYEQTIQQAFQQVSDSLIALQKDHEYRQQQELLTAAAQDADRLSNIRYRNGSASYLEVLTNETNYFAAELNLAQAQLDERLALVQIYNALGGGWQQ